MKTYVALLRGINVGGNNKIDMKRLKETFLNLGYQSVNTYINSGNIVFSCPAAGTNQLEDDIARAIANDFNLSIPVVVRDKASILKLVKEIPNAWQNDTVEKTDVFFLFPGLSSQACHKELPTKVGVDKVLYLEGVMVWHLQRDNYHKSGMHDVIKTKLYKQMTVRNVNTVRKLGKLLEI